MASRIFAPHSASKPARIRSQQQQRTQQNIHAMNNKTHTQDEVHEEMGSPSLNDPPDLQSRYTAKQLIDDGRTKPIQLAARTTGRANSVVFPDLPGVPRPPTNHGRTRLQVPVTGTPAVRHQPMLPPYSTIRRAGHVSMRDGAGPQGRDARLGALDAASQTYVRAAEGFSRELLHPGDESLLGIGGSTATQVGAFRTGFPVMAYAMPPSGMINQGPPGEADVPHAAKVARAAKDNAVREAAKTTSRK